MDNVLESHWNTAPVAIELPEHTTLLVDDIKLAVCYN